MKRLSLFDTRRLCMLLGLGSVLSFCPVSNAYGNGEPAIYLQDYSADGIFIMGKAAAHKGDTVTLTMSIESWLPLQGFNFAVVFDARKIDLLSVTPILSGGTAWDVFDLHVLDRDNTLAGPNFDHHAHDDIWGKAVFSQDNPLADLPGRTRNDVLRLEFKVHADAPAGFVDVIFNELREDPDDPGSVEWNNHTLSRDSGPGHVFYSDVRFLGGILVDPPAGVPFLRGDVNTDGQVSISDAMMVRRRLFQGGPKPPCIDAEDVDDSGQVQLTDAIRLLDYLFLTPLDDLSQIAAPYPGAGLDPNLDALPCESYPLQAPEETDDLVRLGAVEASPGEEVSVPIHVTSNVGIEGFQLMVKYDPALFTPTKRNLDLSGTPFESSNSFNGVNATLAEGLIVIGCVGNIVNSGIELPPGEDVLAGRLQGIIPAEVAPGTEVRLELTKGPDGQGFGLKKLRNELTHQGSARLVSVFPRLEGMVFNIVSDITFFRGDSNFDLKVDVSDAVATLSYLFLGGEAPSCPDAADANDSGRIDLSDAILTLNYLFSGSATLALPHPLRGHDFELDDLGPCLAGRS